MMSRRNYMIISIVMLIILFLFQFSQIIRTTENQYLSNDYEQLKVVAKDEWKGQTIELSETDHLPFEKGKFILYVGRKATGVGSIVTQWTNYTKRQLCITDNITSYFAQYEVIPEFIIIDSKYMDFDRDTSVIEALSERGASIVFCNLPDYQVIENNETLRRILGINFVKEPEVKVEGIKLFGSFLLGGETIYQPKKKEEEKRQDLDLVMPWYVTAGGTKTYMVGIMEDYYDDYEYKNEYFPAIIWRNSLGDSQIFCVCGDYMEQTSGLGILSAMIYELSSYQIYPVVNAQNTLLVDYPLLAQENEKEFRKIYARDTKAFQNDVIWPTLISLSEKYDLKYTSFLAPKYNYTENTKADRGWYEECLKQLKERKSEVGLSLDYSRDSQLSSKLRYDEDFYDRLGEYLSSTSAFLNVSDLGQLGEVRNSFIARNLRTIACQEDIDVPILSYQGEDLTLQSLTSDTQNLTYARDLQLKSIETTLGYDNAKLDFSEVFWPEDQSKHWQYLYHDMSSALATYWKPYRVFDRTTLTESDQRVRTFLNLGFEEERKADEIDLHIDGRGEENCYFILRTHEEEIISVDGGSFAPIEENAFLLTLEEDEVKIHLKPTNIIQ